ncbi:hypothetical protein, partial [Deinococcus sp. KSM4-11]|uniref:hypothetical protein n=1 Tax=Deinococcus sp. KSM4-11 TaxID=2568654 RepID=UPI001454C279
MPDRVAHEEARPVDIATRPGLKVHSTVGAMSQLWLFVVAARRVAPAAIRPGARTVVTTRGRLAGSRVARAELAVTEAATVFTGTEAAALTTTVATTLVPATVFTRTEAATLTTTVATALVPTTVFTGTEAATLTATVATALVPT